MIVIVDFLADGRGMDNEVVRRETERRVQSPEEIAQQLRQAAVVGRRHVFERGTVLARQNPRLEWKTRRVGRQSEKMVVAENHAITEFDFLADHVAENA